MSKKNGHARKGIATKPSLNNTSAKAQRQRISAALIEQGSLTTLYARDTLGIMAPAPRVKELRERGWKVITERINATDSLGVLHHGVARYVLIAGGEL